MPSVCASGAIKSDNPSVCGTFQSLSPFVSRPKEAPRKRRTDSGKAVQRVTSIFHPFRPAKRLARPSGLGMEFLGTSFEANTPDFATHRDGI
jgi:hypothetical protein